MLANINSMILLFTDYGVEGPYLGQVYTKLLQAAPTTSVVNLMADAPRNNPRASAYLLASLVRHIPERGVIFAVVDPGVGNGKDIPSVFKTDSHWFVGPDNGLFDILLREYPLVDCWEIQPDETSISVSFHGRDIYAPVCAKLANNEEVPGIKRHWQDTNQWPDDLHEIIYCDHFGNAMTGIRSAKIDQSIVLNINGSRIAHAHTFSAVKKGDAFWYINSNDLVEIAINQGSAKKQFDLKIGNPIKVN